MRAEIVNMPMRAFLDGAVPAEPRRQPARPKRTADVVVMARRKIETP